MTQKPKHDTKLKKKAIKAEHRKVYGDWNRTTRDMREIMKAGRVANKKAYKEGKIDKQEYNRLRMYRTMEYKIVKPDELYHHGVKGMKWGVRKDDKWHSNYSSEQRKRDSSVYGNSGVKRINKELKKGNSISGARSKEAGRINAFRRKARTSATVGKTIGTVGGAIGGYVLSKYATKKLGVTDPSTQMMVKAAITSGAASVGKQLGTYGARDITMIVGGYKPSKYR